MEVLRLPETTSVQARFLVPTANALYTATYNDLITGTSYSASATSNGAKVVSFTLNSYYLTYSGNLEFDIYLNNALVYSTGVDIVRPYCDITAVKTRLNLTTDQAIQYEALARSIIESEAGSFSFVRKDKEVVGMGMDYLPVNERVYKLYKMYENGYIIHDINDSELNLYKVSLDHTSIVPSEATENKLEYPKVWRDRYYDAAFASGYDYLLDADFGYKVIPGDIQRACEILMQYLRRCICMM